MRPTPILLGFGLVLAAAVAFGLLAVGRGAGPPAEAAMSAPRTDADADGDGIPDSGDNCPGNFNPGQENNDRNFIAAIPPQMVVDLTRANSDSLGNACDTDDDNDGIRDDDEVAGSQCGGIATNPLHEDTDGDHTLDNAECRVGTNPTVGGTGFPNRPTSGDCAELAGATRIGSDRDGDGLRDDIEVCGYNTDPTLLDTDGDGFRDGCEAASLDINPAINSIDQLQLAFGFNNPAAYNAHIDKSRAPASSDQLLLAFMMTPQGQCTTGIPDLTLVSLKIELELPRSCTTTTQLGVRATVRNNGNAPAGPFVVSINGAGQSFYGLAPQGTLQPWAPGYNHPDNDVAIADSQSQVTESNEGNNQLSQALPIPTLPVPCTATPTATPTATFTPTPTPTP